MSWLKSLHQKKTYLERLFDEEFSAADKSEEEFKALLEKKRIENYRLSEKEAQELIQYSREHPDWWIRHVVGIDLWDKQASIIYHSFKHKKVAVKGSYGVGKTFLLANCCVAWPSLMEKSLVLTTAPTGRQVKQQLWREVNSIVRRSRIPLGIECLTTSARYTPDRVAYGIATKDGDIESLTGYHAENVLVCLDQAAGFPKETFIGAEGFITNESSRLIAIANSIVADSYFASIFLNPEQHEDWFRMTISAFDTPNVRAGREIYPGILSADYPAIYEKKYGKDHPMYKIFVLAEFVVEASMSMFDMDNIEKTWSSENYIPLQDLFSDGKPVKMRIAADIGDSEDGGNDSVVLVSLNRKLLEMKRLHTRRQERIADVIVDLMFKYLNSNRLIELEHIKVDALGVGSGVCSLLENRGLPVVRYKSSNRAKNLAEFKNMRAEAYWELSENIASYDLSMLPSEERQKLKEEAMATNYTFTSSGRIKLISKRKIVKKLKRSPDLLDTLVMLNYDTASASLTLIAPVGQEHFVSYDDLTDEDKRALEELDEFLLYVRPEVKGIIKTAKSLSDIKPLLNTEEEIALRRFPALLERVEAVQAKLTSFEEQPPEDSLQVFLKSKEDDSTLRFKHFLMKGLSKV